MMMQFAQDPRIIRTQLLIKKSFIELMNEKDFEQITVKDITQLAMINRATFYRHYVDKHFLFEHILQETMDDICFDEIPANNLLDEAVLRSLVFSLSQLVEQLKVTFGRNYQYVLVMIEKKLKDKFIGFLNAVLPIENPFQQNLVSTMLMTAIYSATCSWISDKQNVSQEQFFQQIVPFIIGAIQPFQLNDT